MRKFLSVTLALVLLGCNASLAQQMGSPRNRPTSGMPNSGMAASGVTAQGVSAPSTTGVLGIMPVPGLGAPGTIPTALGTIPPMTGTAATIAGGSIGSITTCAAAPGFSLDASSAMA